VTFAGRFLGVFFACAVATAVAGAVTGAEVAVAGVPVGLETPTSADLGDCWEHALIASSSPRIVKPAIIASFCWRDQDESIVPEIVLLLVALSVDFLSPDFQIVVMVSPPLRLAQSD